MPSQPRSRVRKKNPNDATFRHITALKKKVRLLELVTKHHLKRILALERPKATRENGVSCYATAPELALVDYWRSGVLRQGLDRGQRLRAAGKEPDRHCGSAQEGRVSETQGWPPRFVGTAFKAAEPSRRETKAARKVAEEAAWRAVCKAVDARDGRVCRCCDKRSDPDSGGLLTRGHRHHIRYRSAGGKDTTDNLVTLCAECHEDEHRNRMTLEGNPDEALLFWRRNDKDEWYISREEISVRVVRHD